MTLVNWLLQGGQEILGVLLAPLLMGWVGIWRAWLQNRQAPPLTQPYRQLFKLFHKEVVIAETASPLFRVTPYLLFGCMGLTASLIPMVITDLPLAGAVDVIALVGLLSLARVFLALAAMDVGTAFGSLGARREMLVSFLAEPALLMVFFTIASLNASTSLRFMVTGFAARGFYLYPSLAFAGVAFLMVLLAENGRIPVDNPETHLELTMIHEAMILEYSGRHLALIEWANALKLLIYFSLGFALFLPFGLTDSQRGWGILGALILFLLKLTVMGAGLAVLETVSAKQRLFRVPEYLGTAFLLAVLAILLHYLLGS
ncbi:respiratory chain complex I subunit 1 family protein [Ferrovum myxofaciens]|jgi:formate hydrogenlyase subunit 4|uniref:Formate hydrogenlyase subunit 4 n=3 Tax=root TaxID=1 RepID=A0A859ABN6_9PROT|nr:NADH-quinone oxidoreductase subunit H [Ferrovum myxofaciens]KXW58106.1 formate hydrogenlyase subunit 4 [Ferrovum myxofaciens]MBU6995760.1 NADH-quinone oxidoreductase subunit H [Ferrovum myxofaciens]QKE39452.1 MAG: NADH-quinone oxidoreductase subunit H [Ferrovum myxofaciens]QWY74727.1 MAG: NADH-quinone oxidoreductase subunit H [Ferrovum myxofaciens]QWY77473.1 MAG: NADH-quinone oxidoreductase subunit H [Ferrovum myxofaciens]